MSSITSSSASTEHYIMDPVERLLSRLEHVRRGGSGWSARCPAHDDRHNSLSIGKGADGRALLMCMTGCDIKAVLEKLDMKLADLFPANGAGKQRLRVVNKRASRRASGGDARAGAAESRGQGQRTAGKNERRNATEAAQDVPGEEASTDQQSGAELSGCTLAQYAADKRLPEQFLRKLGLADALYGRLPAVRIPYSREDGSEVAVRYRTALHKGSSADNRFRWKSGNKPCLYGLWKLQWIRQAGYVVLCEGESDAQTLWYHDIPALGVPGANNWREEWAAHLEGIAVIYVVIEPDKGGEAVRKWLEHSDIRERVRIVRLGEDAKDPSQLYLRSPEQFLSAWQAALDTSKLWTSMEEEEREAAHREAWAACEELARTPDILSRFADLMAQRGVVGESRLVKLVYLGITSRLLQRPASIAVKGPSSAGKSFAVEQALLFFPKSAYYALSAMSERALAYSTEPLKHRILVIYEAAGMTGEFASYLMRSLLSEGRVRYETVEKTRTGLQPKLIEREGPTGLLVTTTAVSLHPENETRLLSIPANDTRDQTKRVLLALADESPARTEEPPAEWLALQSWLEGAEHKVTIPYARQIAESVPPVAVRLRRDFGMLLGLIRAHAILHQASRERDSEGRIVATLDDYAAVRELVVDLVSDGVEAAVPSILRETVRAVEQLHADKERPVSMREIAVYLKLDKSAITRRVHSCVQYGYLNNLETIKGKAAKLEPGDPLPEDQYILPLPESLSLCGCTEVGAVDCDEGECCTVDDVTGGITIPPVTSSAVAELLSEIAEVAEVAEVAGDVDATEWLEVGSGEAGGSGVYRFDEHSGKYYRKARPP